MSAPADSVILVVDDDADLRTIVAEILAEEGYPVATASNGREALTRLAGGERVSMILLDLMMPVMDGWEFRTHQLADPSLAATPVVVFSAHGSAKDAARRMSAAAWLQKPIDVNGLLEVVERVLAGGH